MFIDKIDIGDNVPEQVNVIIEIPKDTIGVKYEFDKSSGAIFVDRFMHTTMSYPLNYGFVPHTLSNDGDPTDVLVISNHTLVPGAVIAVRPVGVLIMEDESGMDEKIIAAPAHKIDASLSYITDLNNIDPYLLKKISHFFECYKMLEPSKWVKVTGWQNAAYAKKLILDAIERAPSKKHS